MSVNEWSGAFLLTQLIEVPIYLWAAHSLPLLKRLTFSIGASTITHPIIWFCLSWGTMSYAALVIMAECFAVGAEGAWGVCWRVPRPWIAALAANGASLVVGLIIRNYFAT
jgi:hypothetical protein